MVSTMRLIGQMLSQGIVLLIFNLILGHTEISKVQPSQLMQLMSSIQVAFIIFATLCVVGVFASMMRGNLRKKAIPVAAVVPPSK